MSERQRAAKRHAAQAGFIYGGRRPFGWQPGPRVTDHAGRTGRRLEPHPVEHQALKDAVTLVLSGAGLREVAVHWQARFGITGHEGGLVSEQKVRAALISPRLVGYRQHQLPPHRRGVSVDPLDHIARTPDGEPVVSQEPVCDLATWHRIQAALRSRGTGVRNGWGTRAWLLTGLLWCPCGGPLAGVAQPQKPDADGHRVVRYVYRCKANRRHGAGTCTGGASITAPPAEQHVIDWLFEFFSSDRLDAHNMKAESAIAEAVARIDADLAVAGEELDVLREKASSLTVGTELHQIITGMIAHVHERIANLHDERVALTVEHPMPLTHQQLVAAWPTLNNESRRTLLRQLIHHIDLAPGRGHPAERLNIVLRSEE
ncbi:MAG: recombinase zinc beta ribbon domain-containing protein [Microthrixaceae bacterium]|nr:recombinase zinc beta ribbon domain-containing protein [Microthrixaceae bacterium]